MSTSTSTFRFRAVNVLVLLGASLAVAQNSPATGPKKTVVVPFVALSPQLPARIGTKAAAILEQELRNQGSFAVAPSAVTPVVAADETVLTSVKKLLSEASVLRGQRKFGDAEARCMAAIEALKAAPAAVTSAGEIADAFTALAVNQYSQGNDTMAEQNLRAALAVAPQRAVTLVEPSPLFAAVVEATRKTVLASATAQLAVESTPSRGVLSLDGVNYGAAPLRVAQVPAGWHWWRLVLPHGETVAGVIELSAGKSARVVGAPKADRAEIRLMSLLAKNKVDAEVNALAGEILKANEATLLLTGLLMAEGDNVMLTPLLFSKAEPARKLVAMRFDGELLSAGVGFLQLTTELAQQDAKIGEVLRLPVATLVTQEGVGNAAREVSFIAEPAALRGEAAGLSAPSTPLSPVPIRKPLTKKP